jgi:hypothetical protein
MGSIPEQKRGDVQFELSRVQESDFDELLEVQFEAFKDVDAHHTLFGPNTPQNRARVKNDFIASMHSDSSDCWMKLTDKSNGRIASAALWKVYPSWDDTKKVEYGRVTWVEGKDKESIEYLMKDFMDRRARYTYNHPHVRALGPFPFLTEPNLDLMSDASADTPQSYTYCSPAQPTAVKAQAQFM